MKAELYKEHSDFYRCAIWKDGDIVQQETDHRITEDKGLFNVVCISTGKTICEHATKEHAENAIERQIKKSFNP